MHQCPFCKGPIEGVPVDVNLTPKQRKVFLMIMNAGPNGIEAHEIMEALFKGQSPTTLRTCVHYINKGIFPLHIKRQSDTFRFVLNKV